MVMLKEDDVLDIYENNDRGLNDQGRAFETKEEMNQRDSEFQFNMDYIVSGDRSEEIRKMDRKDLFKVLAVVGYPFGTILENVIDQYIYICVRSIHDCIVNTVQKNTDAVDIHTAVRSELINMEEGGEIANNLFTNMGVNIGILLAQNLGVKMDDFWNDDDLAEMLPVIMSVVNENADAMIDVCLTDREQKEELRKKHDSFMQASALNSEEAKVLQQEFVEQLEVVMALEKSQIDFVEAVSNTLKDRFKPFFDKFIKYCNEGGVKEDVICAIALNICHSKRELEMFLKMFSEQSTATMLGYERKEEGARDESIAAGQSGEVESSDEKDKYVQTATEEIDNSHNNITIEDCLNPGSDVTQGIDFTKSGNINSSSTLGGEEMSTIAPAQI